MTSLAITGAWYCPARRHLDLMFASGRRYRYSHVPEDVARRFAIADVKGRFFNGEIRGHFPCQPLDEALARAA